MALSKVLAILRPTNLLSLALLAGLGVGGYHAWEMYDKARLDVQARQQLEGAVTALTGEVTALTQENRQLEVQNTLLTAFVDRLTTEDRVAEVEIVAQTRDAEGVLVTTLEFTERDRNGEPLPTRTLETRGNELYVDALVIKFLDETVKQGDPFRGKSLHLFRRVYGDAQQPRHGEELSAMTDGVPDLYRVSKEPSPFEQRLWGLFWTWMRDPDQAKLDGVRVPQIDAAGVRPEPNAKYKITLERDGGLNFIRVK